MFERLQVLFDGLHGLLVLVAFLAFPVVLVVMGIIARVKHVVLDRLRVLRERLQVVRPDEPLASVLLGQGALHVLQVVVSGQVQGVAAGHVVVDQRVVLDDAELLGGVELSAGLVAEVLFVGRFLGFLLFFFLAPGFFDLLFLLDEHLGGVGRQLAQAFAQLAHGVHSYGLNKPRVFRGSPGVAASTLDSHRVKGRVSEIQTVRGVPALGVGVQLGNHVVHFLVALHQA